VTLSRLNVTVPRLNVTVPRLNVILTRLNVILSLSKDGRAETDVLRFLGRL